METQYWLIGFSILLMALFFCFLFSVLFSATHKTKTLFISATMYINRHLTLLKSIRFAFYRCCCCCRRCLLFFRSFIILLNFFVFFFFLFSNRWIRPKTNFCCNFLRFAEPWIYFIHIVWCTWCQNRFI